MKKKPIKILLISALILIGSIIIGGGLFYLLLLLPPVQQKAVTLVTDELNKIVVGDIKIGKVKSNLFSSIELIDLAVRDKKDPKIFVSLSHLHVRYYLPSLLRKRIRILSVNMDRLDAHLCINSKGKGIFPFLPEDSILKKPFAINKEWTIRIGTVRIKEINGAYEDSTLKMFCTARGAKCVAKFPRIDSILITVNVPDGSFLSPWWRGNIDTVSSQVTIQKDSMLINYAYGKGSSATVQGYGKIPFNFFDHWDLHTTVSSDVYHACAVKTYVPDFGPEGRIEAQASWTGTFYNPIYSLVLSASDMTYRGFNIDTISVRGSYDSKEFINENVMIKSELGTISSNGRINVYHLHTAPEFDRYNVDARISNIGIPAVKRMLKNFQKIPGDSAALTMHLEGSGFNDLPRYGQAALKIHQKNAADSLEISMNMTNHLWNISSKWGDNRITGDGRVLKNGVVNGNVVGEIRNPLLLTKYFLNENVSGNVSFKASLAGKIAAPVICAEIKSDALSWHAVRLDALNSSITFDKKLYINRAHSSIYARIDSLGPLIPKNDLKGNVHLVVDAAGPVEHPEMKIAVDGQGVGYQKIVTEKCHGRLDFMGFDSVKIHDLQFSKKSSQLSVDGDISYSDHLNTNLKVQGMSLAGSSPVNAGQLKVAGFLNKDSVNGSLSITDFNVAVFHGWFDLLNNTKGIISGNASVCGKLNNPSAKATVNLKNVAFNNYAANGFYGRCDLHDSVIVIDSTCLTLDSSSKVFISALLPMSPKNGWKLEKEYSRPGKIFIQSDNLNAEAFSRLFKSDWKYTGSSLVSLNLIKSINGWNLGGIANIQDGSVFNTKLKISGTNIYFNSKICGTIDNPSMTYSVNTGKFLYDAFRIDSSKIAGSFVDGLLEIKNGVIDLFSGGKLNINGQSPLQIQKFALPDSGVKFLFTISDLSLPELNAFAGNELIRGGVAHGNGSFGIEKGLPFIDGKIFVEKGKFSIEGAEPQIGPINTELLLHNDTIKISSCNGKWNSGAIDANGYLVWTPDSIKDVAINGKLKNISIDLPDIATSRIQNADFFFSKKKTGFLVTGNVDLGATQIIRDIRLSDFVGKLNNVELSQKGKDPFLQSIALQIKVNFIENPILDINMGYMDFTGNLNLTGNVQDPTFTGELSIIDGYVYYLDRKFIISNGSISNYDQNKLDPSINLKAATNIDFTESDSNSVVDSIMLDIHGILSNLKVNLHSLSGGLSEADIISLLTVGQKIGSVGGDLKQRIKVFASQSLLGLGTRKLEQVLNIDRIDISGDIFDMSSQKSPKLTITKRFTPKLLVTYETAIANLSNRKITASYRLTKHLYLSGETENKGKSGLDFIFKYSK